MKIEYKKKKHSESIVIEYIPQLHIRYSSSLRFEKHTESIATRTLISAPSFITHQRHLSLHIPKREPLEERNKKGGGGGG